MTDNPSSGTNGGITDFIKELKTGDFASLVDYAWEDKAKSAVISNFPENFHFILQDYLASKEFQGLYSHQIESVNALSRGKNIVIATGTSSGKTYCYNLPILDAILNQPDTTALYLFPTKALTEDQYKKLEEIADFVENHGSESIRGRIKPGIYDGDTPTGKRTAIRNASNIILSNPDMLHLGILPHHTKWSQFLSNLRFIVLDEAHTYRGVFGSHVANVIRRLKRILTFYNSNPQFVLASATIQNPGELAEKLIEEEVICITDDGAYHNERHYFFLNPPVVDQNLGLRRGLIDQSVEVAESALNSGIQSIIFARTKKTVELTVKELRQRYSKDNLPELQGYRSGFLPKDRRNIESGLREGQINAVISTNAMELGIDMGGVDTVLLMGYPGTIASFLQQSGRAGRRDQPSAAVLIASSSPLDQYIIRHPEFIRGMNPEKALLDANNPLLLLNHLRCALFELPFEEGESFGNLDWSLIQPYLEVLADLSQAVSKNEKVFWMADMYPANEISLRNIGGQPFQLRLVSGENREKSVLLGIVDYQSAFRTIHPEAVYLHNGLAYRVLDLDLELNEAALVAHKQDYYTDPKIDSQIEIIEVQQEVVKKPYSKILADIKVIEQVTGYKKVDWLTREILSHHEQSMPETELQTIGFGLKFSQYTVEALRARDAWMNDVNQYGSTWNQVRKIILERDQFTCQICGLSGDSASLHVHHKIPFRTFSNLTEANRVENLITLCPTCHRLAEQNVKIRSGLGGLGYLFAHIAPLHLMCDTNDIGYFIDPISKYNEKMPLLILYDQFPGGIGLSAELYVKTEDVLRNCQDVIQHCPCKDGCPSCVGPAGENGLGGKDAALELTLQLLSEETRS